MQPYKLLPEDFEAILRLVHGTIRKTYQRYYPAEAVEFFIGYHSEEAVLGDLRAGRVFGLKIEGALAATVSLEGFNINRMFVLPDFQGRGLGKLLLNSAETIIRHEHGFAQLAASIPGYPFYISQGYHTHECGSIKLENDKEIIFQVMRKKFKKHRA